MINESISKTLTNDVSNDRNSGAVHNTAVSVICFHNPNEENGYLSNWYMSDFIVDGKLLHLMIRKVLIRYLG